LVTVRSAARGFSTVLAQGTVPFGDELGQVQDTRKMTALVQYANRVAGPTAGTPQQAQSVAHAKVRGKGDDVRIYEGADRPLRITQAQPDAGRRVALHHGEHRPALIALHGTKSRHRSQDGRAREDFAADLRRELRQAPAGGLRSHMLQDLRRHLAGHGLEDRLAVAPV
jgi:hypothetical protein